MSKALVNRHDTRSHAGEAYRALRGEVIAGTLAPGARLSPAEISARLGIGPTPVREALARLAAENFAIAIEQRGFRVPPLHVRELSELLALLLDFERGAIFRSMREGGDGWEAAIVASLHLLKRTTPPHPGQSAEALAEWGARHDAFHRALLSGAEMPWLLRFHATTMEQIERYRSAILGRRDAQGNYADTAAKLADLISHEAHQRLAEAVLSRDELAADACLSAHISETATIFSAMFARLDSADNAA